MGEATSGPFVDAISRHWSQLGREAGAPLGWAQGFNYGVKAVYYEAHAKEDLTFGDVFRMIPPNLFLPEEVKRANEFCRVKESDPNQKPAQPCLEQIWFDIGFELARSEEYARGIPEGAEAAYRSMREHSKVKDGNRIPDPPEE